MYVHNRNLDTVKISKSFHFTSIYVCFARCVVGVRKEWTTPDDCIRFWSTDYNDDPSDKQLLMEKMALWCFKCSPPQGRATRNLPLQNN